MLPRRWAEGPWGFGVTAVPVIIAALAVNLVLIRLGWSRPATLGWRGRRVGAMGLLVGTGIGLAMAGAAVALVVFLGSAGVYLSGEPLGTYATVAFRVAVVLLLAALAEELLFRGYPLARLSLTLGRIKASVFLALVFAAMHLWNPDVSALGLVNVALGSLVMSAAFFARGGILTAWGVHFGWNGGLSLGADAPVSGIDFRIPVLEFAPGDTAWITGGGFGPEGGLVATAVLSVGLVLLARRVMGAREGSPA
jgi:membrane protease YdiL (CAAX protease family)